MLTFRLVEAATGKSGERQETCSLVPNPSPREPVNEVVVDTVEVVPAVVETLPVTVTLPPVLVTPPELLP